MVTGKVVVSADGKTRTVNTSGKNAKGETRQDHECVTTNSSAIRLAK